MIELIVRGDKLDEIHELIDRMTPPVDETSDIAIQMLVKRTDDLSKAMEVVLNEKVGNKKARQASKRVDK